VLFRSPRPFLVCVLLLGSTLLCNGGLTTYAERGKTDFDTALQILNPYGTWSKIDGLWAYTPRTHPAPYTDGQWIYTEYGWYWKGNLPHSWVTEHYGYWKRGANKVWSWYPGPFWLPQIVEIRATATHIGWRSAAVDADGNFVEQPADRYAKTDEWTFVTLAQFTGPITPSIVAKPEVVQSLLEDSTESMHSYFTYRAIDRPGPHPADFIVLSKQNGGMFPPRTLLDVQAAPPSAVIPGLTPKIPDGDSPAAKATGTNGPVLLGQDADTATDKRKVKYWITMSLPTYWTPPPPDAKADEIYIYRPDFYQDDDGIARRITLWFNPKARSSLKEILAGSRTTRKPDTETAETTSATPAVPVTPEPSPPSRDPFRSPFEDSYHGAEGPHASAESSKNPEASSGSNDANAPIPPPLVNTNAAPQNPR